jgi:S-methylmethionine-dependent homocysteine/selenocysteine methylase
MPRYRYNLPQLSQELFLTDGGIEDTLILDRGIDLSHDAACDSDKDADRELALVRYFQDYASLARDYRVGLMLESPTWQANSDWGIKLGYSYRELKDINRRSISLLEKIRKDYETRKTKIVISGCVGTRKNSCHPSDLMTAIEAEEYHFPQVVTFADTEADLVTAAAMTDAEEAIGIVRAAQFMRMPVTVTFVVETDGKLPTGQTLGEAIARVDGETDQAPLYYGIHCQLTSHFTELFGCDMPWFERVRCIRAAKPDNYSLEELGDRFRSLVRKHPHLNILGGCRGTDTHHVETICLATLPLVWMNLSRDSLPLPHDYSFVKKYGENISVI